MPTRVTLRHKPAKNASKVKELKLTNQACAFFLKSLKLMILAIGMMLNSKNLHYIILACNSANKQSF